MSHRVTQLTSVLIVTLTFATTGISSTMDEAKIELINSLFSPFNDTESPGMAMGLIRQGELVFDAEFGMADIGNHVKITDSTVFYVGSMAKQFTAYATFLLVREGRLSLDRKVIEFFPQLAQSHEGVTIRHLLYHTSGIRDFVSLANYAGIRRGLDYMSQSEIERLIVSQHGLNFEPGERFGYSNSNYWLLAQIVEQVAGEAFADFVKARVFDPLDMRQTYFAIDINRIAEHLATGYAKGADSNWVHSFPVYSTYGAGGMFTSLRDLAKWDQVFYTTPQDKYQIIDTMLTSYVLNDGNSTGEGSGIISGEYRGERLQHHSGNTLGFGCEMLRFPDDTITIVVLFNTERRWADPSDYAYGVTDIVLFDDTLAIPDRPDSDLVQFEGQYDAVEQVWRGLYLLEDGTTVTLTSDAGHSGVSVDGGRPIHAEIVGDTLMVVRGRNWRIRRPQKPAGDIEDSLEFVIGPADALRTYPLYRPLSVLDSELEGFLGRYISEEIDAVWIVDTVGSSLQIANGRFHGSNLIAERLFRYDGHSFTDGSLAYYTFKYTDEGKITAIELMEPRLQGIVFEKTGQ